MPKFFRNQDHEPYRGEEYYQVAHDYEQSFFESITTNIENLFAIARSPILNREFTFENDGATRFLNVTSIIDDNADTSRVGVTQTLSIAHTTCKPPRCVLDYYHVRIEDKVQSADTPIINEYYIEKLSSGLHFGTMRGYDLTFYLQNLEPTGQVHPDETPMTIYDIFWLNNELSEHFDSAGKEANHADLIKNYD